jgi:hypothetical protein
VDRQLRQAPRLRARFAPLRRRSDRSVGLSLAADGIDESAWALVADHVWLAHRRDRSGLVHQLKTRVVPVWQDRLGRLYALYGLQGYLQQEFGGRPSETDIHDLVVGAFPHISDVSNFSRLDVEDMIRQVFGFPPLEPSNSAHVLIRASVTLGALVDDPAESLRSVRPFVATVAAEKPDIFRIATGPHLVR